LLLKTFTVAGFGAESKIALDYLGVVSLLDLGGEQSGNMGKLTGREVLRCRNCNTPLLPFRGKPIFSERVMFDGLQS
jgi:hypothetical protein